MLDSEFGPESITFTGDEEEFYGHLKRPSKAAERRSWKEDAQKELEELGDLYPELAEVLNEVRL